MNEIVLINVSGGDRPGLSAALTAVLADYDVPVLDIGQASIHAELSLGILVQIPTATESAAVLKDILFKAHEMDV
ncbi:MAG: phosphoserine phosphatase SerB, partial [Gammaproteobacteria bacterium]